MQAQFSQTMTEMSSTVHCETWNGDDNYSTLVDKDTTHPFIEELLGFGQKLVNMPIKTKINIDTSKRKGQQKAHYDFMIDLPLAEYISSGMTKLIKIINSSPHHFQVIYIDILARFIFRERAISSGTRSEEGKGNRDISYALFVEFEKFMPETAIKLLSHFPNYGCFRDLNALIGHYHSSERELMVTIISDVFVKALDEDVRKIINYDEKELAHSTINSRITQLHTVLQNMQPEEIKKKFKDINISLAGKWFPRDKSGFVKKRQ